MHDGKQPFPSAIPLGGYVRRYLERLALLLLEGGVPKPRRLKPPSPRTGPETCCRFSVAIAAVHPTKGLDSTVLKAEIPVAVQYDGYSAHRGPPKTNGDRPHCGAAASAAPCSPAAWSEGKCCDIRIRGVRFLALPGKLFRSWCSWHSRPEQERIAGIFAPSPWALFSWLTALDNPPPIRKTTPSPSGRIGGADGFGAFLPRTSRQHFRGCGVFRG